MMFQLQLSSAGQTFGFLNFSCYPASKWAEWHKELGEDRTYTGQREMFHMTSWDTHRKPGRDRGSENLYGSSERTASQLSTRRH